MKAGVGGKNDATSLLPNIVSLITSIGKDHAAQLGNTLKEIAKDKAGIGQNDSTLIVQSAIDTQLLDIISKESQFQNTALLFSENYISKVNKDRLQLKIGAQTLEVNPKLQGHFQRQNLNLVIETWLFLFKNNLVNHLASIKGIEQTNWNARFEIIEGNPTFIIDAAHNEPALKVLIHSLDEFVSYKNRILVLGISKEKDIKKMSPLIGQIASEVYLTDDFYKSNTIEILKNSISNISILNQEEQTLTALIDFIKKKHSNKTIIVTGSIFMIGKARMSILKGNEMIELAYRQTGSIIQKK